MPKYKVVSLFVQGKGKKIYEAGDTVFDTDFAEGVAEEKLHEGHLTLLETTKAEDEAARKKQAKADEENKATAEAHAIAIEAETKRMREEQDRKEKEEKEWSALVEKERLEKEEKGRVERERLKAESEKGGGAASRAKAASGK